MRMEILDFQAVFLMREWRVLKQNYNTNVVTIFGLKLLRPLNVFSYFNIVIIIEELKQEIDLRSVLHVINRK